MRFSNPTKSFSLLLSLAIVGVWIITPSYVCGIRCNPQWWMALVEMTPSEHMLLEAAEGCRENPELVLELDFQDICDLNYQSEERIVESY